MREYYSLATDYGVADELFKAIITLNKKRVSELKANGIALTENVKNVLENGPERTTSIHQPGFHFRFALVRDIKEMPTEEYAEAAAMLRAEIGKPLHFSEAVWFWENKRAFEPDFFDVTLENFDQKRMSKKKTMKEIIDKNALGCLSVCEKHGWLKMPKTRDELIEYANENGKTEAAAWLLDFKNRTADFKAERVRAEKKAERELNAAPDSALELGKLWSWKKQENGELIITSYKGKETEVTIPAKIGNNIVTAVGEKALSYGASRASNKASRLMIERIVVPNGIKTLGKAALGGSGEWGHDPRLKEVVLPETLDIFNDVQAAEAAPNILAIYAEAAAVIPRMENAVFYCIKNSINYRFADEEEIHIPYKEVIASDALYAAIIAADREKTAELKKSGAVLTDYIKDFLLHEMSYGSVLYEVQREFFKFIIKTKPENREFILSSLKAETGEPLYYDQYGFSRKMPPENLDCVLEYFSTKYLDRIGEMRKFIIDEKTEHLAICAKHGWLKNSATCEKMIRYASDNGKTESAAWLLDYKSRTADLSAERARAERKMQRELNADPNSITELKKIWRFETREDNTIIITGYKGGRTEITVPEKLGGYTVTALGEYAFSPDAKRIREEQRAVRRAITKVTLPDTIESIGEFAFFKCKLLTEINIPGRLAEISKGMLDITGLEHIVIGGNVKKIGGVAFWGCRDLKNVKLCEGVEEIDVGAFYGCTGLETIVLPRSLKKAARNTMSEGAFWNCYNLTALVHKGSYAEKYCEENKINYKYAEE